MVDKNKFSLEEVTVGGEKILPAVREELDRFSRGEEYSNIYIKGFPGGGKTHWLKLIKEILEREDGKIYTVTLNPDKEAIISEKNLSVLISRAVKYEAGADLAGVQSLLRESVEKAVILAESPERIFAGGKGVLLAEAGREGFLVITASDLAAGEEYDDFLQLALPEWGIEQLCEMLLRRGYNAKTAERLKDFYRLVDFAPRKPRAALALAEAMEKADYNTGELFQRLICVSEAEFQGILSRLSFQQKLIYLTICKSDKMLTAGEIGVETGFPVTVINTQLKRMRDSGILTEVSVRGRRALHYPSQTLIRYWLNPAYEAGEYPLIKVLDIWNELEKMEGKSWEVFLGYAAGWILAAPELQDEVRTVTGGEYFPEYPYESLSKTAASYLRGGDYRRVEAVMEVEAERSLNGGQNMRAGRSMLFLGIARILLENYEGAKSAFKEAIARGEKHPLAETNLGALYAREGNMVSARGMFQQAVKAVEKLPQAYAGLGAVIRAGGDFKQAEEYFVRSLQARKDYAPAMLGLANIHFTWGDYDTALNLAEAGLKSEGDNRLLLRTAAAAAYRWGKYKLCAKYCRELFEKFETNEAGISELYLCAQCTDSLLQVEEENFGLAERAYSECFRKEISIKMVGEVLTAYMLALWRAGEERFWLKLVEILAEKLGAPAFAGLKLHRMAASRRAYGKAVKEGERLFPEERAVYERLIKAGNME